ncbi:MAG: AraC family transcriptional regulator, partial [Pseudomonadota bacterium]
ATEIFSEVPDGSRAKPVSARKFSWYAERIDHARERLGADLEDDVTASDLARAVGMSMFHFTRLFAELVGVPPHRYRLRARLAAAHAMLRDGRSVTETCYACGFNNLSHFSRSFAQAYGAPPSRIGA